MPDLVEEAGEGHGGNVQDKPENSNRYSVKRQFR